MATRKHTTVFRFDIWLALGLFAALVVTFIIYIRAEHRVNDANNLRQQSLLLADEMRQSSDDLTRMARSYVATGDPRYKEYYQHVIAIRDGTMPRPKAYQNIYWELVLIGERPAPTAGEQAISLMELMRQAEFTPQELRILNNAKINSDTLTTTELQAMQLVQDAGAERETARNQALALVFGDNYNLAKAASMQPINQFYTLMDERTTSAVQRAEHHASMARWVLIGIGLTLLFMLWRISCALRTTLGGSVDEVYHQIKLIGTGNFSATIKHAKQNSVLAWLGETQRNLQQVRQERLQIENAKQESDERFHRTFKFIPNPTTLQTTQGILLDCSDAFCEATGFNREEIIGRNVQDLGIWANQEERRIMRERLLRGDQVKNFEFQLRRRNGEIRNMLISACHLSVEPEPLLLMVAQDITARKQAELALQESALHTQAILDNMFDGVITINDQGEIESFNPAASHIFGYSQDEVLGENIALLIPPHHHSPHASYLKYQDESLEGEVLNILREVEGIRKDGEIFPMSISITKILRAGKVTFVGLVRDISQQRHDEEEIYRLAFYDPLTNLPNRRLLFDRLQQAIHTSCRTDQHGALMFLDLDHFKQLNDSLGHDVGDILLQQVAARLQACVREGDSVARMGGDEFVMLIEALSLYPNEAAAQAEMIAHKILESLSQPYRLLEHTYVITPSVGIVVFLHQQETLDELIKKADVAMYQAKTAGRNNARFFDPTMQAAVSVRVELEKNMRLALEREEFLLHYQLQVDRAGTPTGVEALVRWNHPEHGMVSPAAFIPLAEETGMILTLGQWVLETACAQLVKWAATPATATWTMAVNVSISQFAQPSFVANVATALQKTGANPHLLKLELTETILAKDVDDVIVKMFEIKALGVTFSLDDFGTGYSSLSYLKRLPLDQLKIDQSFVRDLLTDNNDAVIAQTIIALGHSLGLNVIAEGVESFEQRDVLAAMGCDAYQGYYFARPVMATELLQTINKLPC
jgi:diguanylate cyclase (GGDEF)-like protein/PAS domain S-box-containing protein